MTTFPFHISISKDARNTFEPDERNFQFTCAFMKDFNKDILIVRDVVITRKGHHFDIKHESEYTTEEMNEFKKYPNLTDKEREMIGYMANN